MKRLSLFICLSVGLTVFGGISHISTFAKNTPPDSWTNKITSSATSQFDRVLTKIDAQGYIFDNHNICVARIDPNGNIYDGNNKNLGKIYPNGYIYNGQNDNLGRVDKKGNIYTPYSVFIGKVDKNGDVYNSNNVKVGQVAKNRKSTALLLLVNGNSFFTQR